MSSRVETTTFNSSMSSKTEETLPKKVVTFQEIDRNFLAEDANDNMKNAISLPSLTATLSRSSLYSSSNDSLRSFRPPQRSNEDDATSIEDSILLNRSNSLRRMSKTENPSRRMGECEICLDEKMLCSLSCCRSSICSFCIYLHLSSQIREAQIRIHCPSCPHIFTREEILSFLSENDLNGEIAEKYKRFYADINGEPHIKTCPQCCSIKEIDKKLVENNHRKRDIPRRVICDDCQFVWCFYCHSPWHEKMTCKEYKEGEKMLKAWASKKDQNQYNAQRCPRCKVFISRNGGCPHMVCSKCHCDFCYNCGRRRFSMKFLGSHESRFSPFGCKYNLYPDKPILRHTVRGLVAGAATLAAPVAAVGAVAVLAVGTTIGAPTYGTYRLVKHIRQKRASRRLRRFITQSTPNINENSSHSIEDNDEDVRRGIEASIESYRLELESRNEPIPEDLIRHCQYDQENLSQNDDDDDDDSFDD